MPTQDEEFIKKLRATFKVEAEEHLQAIASMLLELEKSPSSGPPAAVIENIYREAHSLKGAARAVDLSGIEAICHGLEGVFSAWKRRQLVVSPEAFDALHDAVDTIRRFLGLSEAGQVGGEQRQRDESVQRLKRLVVSEPSTTRDAVDVEVARPEAPPSQVMPSQPVDSEKAAVADTVRISIAKLDSRLLQAEDMLVVKAMTAQRATELQETTALFEQWRNEWAKVSVEARALRRGLEQPGKNTSTIQPVAVSSTLINFLDWNCDYLRLLENKLTFLTAQAQQDRHGVDKRVDDLLEDSKKLLMLPFSTLATIFPKLVRDLCRDQEKEAELVVQGGEVEIDKRILEEMKDALIHILRNCVDHGVEKPAERARLNKPALAAITVTVCPVNGNKVEILVSDDGAGVDLQQVKGSAVRHGVLSEADARAIRDQEALALTFHSEVSTSPAVTAISGRGLGMAIVRAKTEKLGGQASIESQRYVGTTLRMLLPLTLTTFRGILVAVADRIFMVPTVNVERVLRVDSREIKTVENRETIALQGRIVSLARLDAVLELSRKPCRGDGSAPVPIVVLHSADQRIAIVVDEVLHEEEVLVKPLGKPLVRVRNIAGATVLGSGKPVPILNVSDLMKSARTHNAPVVGTVPIGKDRQAPSQKVLVVEDSITSRMLLKGILESAGYRVKTAVDGMEAFAVLRQEQFDLVVSDVEMPRLNGFDLTFRIRADKRLADLPVVLVTALESREERERGVDAGANAYIIKSSFDQSNLLEVIHRLI